MGLNNEQTALLEDIIDSAELSDVIEALAGICYEKAEHVQSVWNDSTLARSWRKDGDRLNRIIKSFSN